MKEEQQFSLDDTLKHINLYGETMYSKSPIPKQSKVFYRIEEWSGWRFYFKAIKHKDWRSIIGHIRNEYLTP